MMRANLGEEDDRMSAVHFDTLILLIVTWLPMIWVAKPAKHLKK